MIPNLTIIVAVYAILRLFTMALRQFPDIEKLQPVRFFVMFLAIGAIALVVLCALDTLGIGMSLGSSIETRKGRSGSGY